VYTASSTLGLTGTLTLDAQGDPNAVFIFQVGSALTTASVSTVSLINGASPCNVYWQIGSSATLGTNSVFVGTVMALTSISATTGTTIQGRLLARNGSVTLDTNTITRPNCAPPTTTTTTTAPGGSTTTVPGGGSTTSVPGGGSTTVPGGGSTTSVPGGGSTTVPGGGGTTVSGGGSGSTVPGGGMGGPGGPGSPGGAGSGGAGGGATTNNGAAARDSRTLPRTGSPLALTAATGLAFLLVGAALVAARRRATRSLA
jgi:hypothetical protein